MPTDVYVGLGSNLNNPRVQLRRALRAMSRLPGTDLVTTAPWYRSKPVGPAYQPDYVNTVAALRTVLSPLQLLTALQSIEHRQGRKRIVKWGPRNLDLDILLFGDKVMRSARLTIPHRRLAERNFVLHPLADIAPNLQLPDGTRIQRLLANVATAGIVRIEAGERRGSTG